MFDFSNISIWFDNLLQLTLGLPSWLAITIECVIVGLLIIVGYALLAIALIFMERKVCAYFQCRLGPMRVGPWGLLQVFADVLKMLIKEIFFVDKADKLLYALAPILVIVGSIGAFAFLPWNNGAVILDDQTGIIQRDLVLEPGFVQRVRDEHRHLVAGNGAAQALFGALDAAAGNDAHIVQGVPVGLCPMDGIIVIHHDSGLRGVEEHGDELPPGQFFLRVEGTVLIAFDDLQTGQAVQLILIPGVVRDIGKRFCRAGAGGDGGNAAQQQNHSQYQRQRPRSFHIVLPLISPDLLLRADCRG